MYCARHPPTLSAHLSTLIPNNAFVTVSYSSSIDPILLEINRRVVDTVTPRGAHYNSTYNVNIYNMVGFTPRGARDVSNSRIHN
jgi:plasmid replication initiation protein